MAAPNQNYEAASASDSQKQEATSNLYSQISPSLQTSFAPPTYDTSSQYLPQVQLTSEGAANGQGASAMESLFSTQDQILASDPSLASNQAIMKFFAAQDQDIEKASSYTNYSGDSGSGKTTTGGGSTSGDSGSGKTTTGGGSTSGDSGSGKTTTGGGSTSGDSGSGKTTTGGGSTSGDSGSGKTTTGGGTTGDGNTSDIKLSSTLQNVVNSLGLKANLSGSVDSVLTGFGSDGDKAYALSDYGQSNANGTFTEDNQPGPYGNVTTKDAATGTQLFVADVNFNPADVKKENSWPAVWGLSGWNAGSPLNQEVDAMEYFGKDIDPTKLAGTTLHNWIKGDKSASTDETATIPSNLFDTADTTGVEVAALLKKNGNSDNITTYIDGTEEASWNVAANSPALTTPMYWLMGTGDGEPMTIENVQLYTPSDSTVTAYKPDSSTSA